MSAPVMAGPGRTLTEVRSTFHDLVIGHPLLTQTLNRIKFYLEASTPYVVFVIGPTGVGKTTTRNLLIEHIERESHEYPRGWVPVGGIRAVAPTSGRFDWIDCWKRCLSAIYEPLIDFKVAPPDPDTIVGPRDAERTYRMAVESAIRHRHLRAFWFDEAHHMAMTASGKTGRAHAEALKSLSEETDVPLVLFGHYELYELKNLTGQLIRRTKTIHFPRYNLADKTEAEQFRNILYTFERRLPLAPGESLTAHLETCYQETLGLVGILKEWLEAGLMVAASESPDAQLRWRHLAEGRRSREERRAILNELLEGEKKFDPRVDATAEDDALCGLEAYRLTQQREQKASPQAKSATPKQQSKPRRPGQTKPKRHPVGSTTSEAGSKVPEVE